MVTDSEHRMRRPAIAVHGGAGRAAGRKDQRGILDGVRRATETGRAILAAGGAAADAVEAAVVVLEDDPLFNAGYGAVLTDAGGVELDAAIMTGLDGAAGAVGALGGFPNPVRIAREVMREGRHVLLVADGAAAFARERGIEPVPPAALVAPRQRERWRRARGTVGAVAVDRHGHTAAATSTGGMFGKRAGRVGDTPLVGAGTYADGAVAVSCTGHGERILRATLGRDAALEAARGADLEAAATAAVTRLGRFGGGGGLILVGRAGAIACACDTPSMPVGHCGAEGDVVVRDVGAGAD